MVGGIVSRLSKNRSKRSVIDLFQLRSVSQIKLVRSLGKLGDVLNTYKDGKNFHIVMDNLNTHFRGSFAEEFGKYKSDALLSMAEFHHKSKHASWMSIAEIEINVMDIECTDRRFESYNDPKRRVKAWTEKRRRDKNGIECKFNWEK